MNPRLLGMLAHGAVLALPWLVAQQAGAAVAAAIWVLGTAEADPDGGSAEAVPRSEAARAVLLLGVLAVGLATAAPVGTAHGVLGVGLLGSGLALRRAAIHALGPAFTARIVVGERVRRGPYAWLDHPSELGLMLAAVGFVALCGSGPALALCLPCVVVPATLRMAAEDAAWSPTAR